MIARHNSLTEDSAANTNEGGKGRNGIDRLPWDNLRLFLAVAEAGSFRSAAVHAGVSINTIRSKVERLERQAGGPLLRRSVEGVALTQDGREILQIAREMRELGRTTARVARGAIDSPAAVTIATTEGVGTAWLVPQISALQNGDPDLKLTLTVAPQSPDVLFRDVDIALQIDRPSDPSLVVERLASLHFMPFASKAYIEAHGVPKSLADAAAHRLVWQCGSPVGSDLMATVIDDAVRAKLVTFETNTSTAHYWAVANGAGIGFLPTYAKLLDPALMPVDIGLVLQRDVFVVRHPQREKAVVDKAAAWIADAFDNVRYPCFAEAFVHPSDFPASESVAPLFGARSRR